MGTTQISTDGNSNKIPMNPDLMKPGFFSLPADPLTSHRTEGMPNLGSAQTGRDGGCANYQSIRCGNSEMDQPAPDSGIGPEDFIETRPEGKIRASRSHLHGFSGSNASPPAGFTLIELSVVLFLIGLLFFTAMPKLDNFLFQADLKSAARSLKSAVHLVRARSISSHRPAALHFDLDKGRYWGTYLKDNDGQETHSQAPSLLPPRSLPKGIKFLDAYNMNTEKKTFGRLRSAFNSKGVIEETVLHLADGRDRILTVIINAYTGRFLLYNEYVDVEYGQGE